MIKTRFVSSDGRCFYLGERFIGHDGKPNASIDVLLLMDYASTPKKSDFCALR
jgi:hypothetical protein